MKKFLVLAVLALAVTACKVSYTASGADIEPDVKTISVEYFPNYAPLVQPNLSQNFTEALKDIFITRTNLSLVSREGDLQFSGSITGYSVTPIAAQANETAAQSRLTITVKVIFKNIKHPEKDFEQSFTRFADFDSSEALSSVEDALIETINAELTENIFNRAVVNW